MIGGTMFDGLWPYRPRQVVMPRQTENWRDRAGRTELIRTSKIEGRPAYDYQNVVGWTANLLKQPLGLRGGVPVGMTPDQVAANIAAGGVRLK